MPNFVRTVEKEFPDAPAYYDMFAAPVALPPLHGPDSILLWADHVRIQMLDGGRQPDFGPRGYCFNLHERGATEADLVKAWGWLCSQTDARFWLDTRHSGRMPILCWYPPLHRLGAFPDRDPYRPKLQWATFGAEHAI